MIDDEPIAEGDATPISAPGADAKTTSQRAFVINVLRYVLLVVVIAAAVWWSMSTGSFRSDPTGITRSVE